MSFTSKFIFQWACFCLASGKVVRKVTQISSDGYASGIDDFFYTSYVPIWPLSKSGAKCGDARCSRASRVSTLAECEELAVDQNRKYFSFRQRGSRLCCVTSDTCEPVNESNWFVYERPAERPSLVLGEFVNVTLLPKPQYIMHTKWHDYQELRGLTELPDGGFNPDDLSNNPGIKIMAESFSLMAQSDKYTSYQVATDSNKAKNAKSSRQIKDALLNRTGGKMVFIGYSKTGVMKGPVWISNYTKYKSPWTGLYKSSPEMFESKFKFDMAYVPAAKLAADVDAAQTIVEVTHYDYAKTYETTGAGCGYTGLGIYASTWDDGINRSVSRCSWGKECTPGYPCEQQQQYCDRNPTAGTEEFVFWIRIRNELMRVNRITNTSQHYTGLIFDWFSTASSWTTSQVENLGTKIWNTTEAATATKTIEFLNPSFRSGADLAEFTNMPEGGGNIAVIHGTATFRGAEMGTTLVLKASGVFRTFFNGELLGIAAGKRSFKLGNLPGGSYPVRIEVFPTTMDPMSQLSVQIMRPKGQQLTAGETWGPVSTLRYFLHVTRGYEGTTKASHSAGATVTAPMYSGSAANECGFLAPYGHRSRMSYWVSPHEGSKTLDYWGDLMCWDPERDETGKCAYNHGEYFDASGVDLPSFNMGDCKARKEHPWNFETDNKLTEAERQKQFELQYSIMASKYKEKCGIYPVIVANGGSYDNTPENDFFLRPGGGTPMGIFQHSEAGFKKTDAKWAEQMIILKHIFDKDLGVSLQCKHSHHIPWNARIITHHQAMWSVYSLEYCYANYLLVKNAGKHVPQLEWKPFDSFVGMYEWYHEGAKADPATWTTRYGTETHPMFKYPLGDPVENKNISDYAIPNTGTAWGPSAGQQGMKQGIHMRRFENGLVFVNPDAPGSGLEDINLMQLSESHGRTNSTLVKLSSLGFNQNMIDASTGQVVDEVDVPNGRAKFLLYSASLETPVRHHDKQMTPYWKTLRADGFDDYGNRAE